ncbi:MAG: hypothetical protein M5U09_01975 [Gammaproteobacteria bacterium]|nr:hypothetical protein [Gammaproteobacteria bacterium]
MSIYVLRRPCLDQATGVVRGIDSIIDNMDIQVSAMSMVGCPGKLSDVNGWLSWKAVWKAWLKRLWKDGKIWKDHLETDA